MITKPPNRPVGRPSFTGKRMSDVTVTLSDEDLEHLRSIDRNRSNAVRILIAADRAARGTEHTDE